MQNRKKQFDTQLEKKQRRKDREASGKNLITNKRSIPCPKCGATRGLHRYAVIPHDASAAAGLSCCMCGYWLDIAKSKVSARHPATLPGGSKE
jgi:C4-type Zn-finger protein